MNFDENIIFTLRQKEGLRVTVKLLTRNRLVFSTLSQALKW